MILKEIRISEISIFIPYEYEDHIDELLRAIAGCLPFIVRIDRGNEIPFSKKEFYHVDTTPQELSIHDIEVYSTEEAATKAYHEQEK